MELLRSGGNFAHDDAVLVSGEGSWESAFDVSGLAVAAIAAAGESIAKLSARLGNNRPFVSVDRVLASRWFDASLKPIGWELPPAWDTIAGDYRCADGWIRLHTNAAHHRAAALQVLGLPDESSREEVAAEVLKWQGQELEQAIIDDAGCAAVMCSQASWTGHPQGMAVASEPLVAWSEPRMVAAVDGSRGLGTSERPLAGVRVLDLTRVVAGPVATRMLAYLGAEVLRIDPPWWQEPALEAEMTVGKRCARLDARTEAGSHQFKELVDGAHMIVQGYRPGALKILDDLAVSHPHLPRIRIDAYGWSGPWRHRRGFDSLVQMSSGIAHAGMMHFGSEKPHPLPVQALDHATSYFAAAAAIDAWRDRLDGTVRDAHLSLARTAHELMLTNPSHDSTPLKTIAADQLIPESTRWGQAQQLPFPLAVNGVVLGTDVPANSLGSSEARW